MKKLYFFLVILILISMDIPVLKADFTSLNSGGTGNIILNPEKFIEGFFFCDATTCSELGYSCGEWSDNCGSTLNCGSCSTGYSCTAGTCVSDGSGDSGSGGGSSGGGGGGAPSITLTVIPEEFNINLAINTNKQETIVVKNIGNYSKVIDISQEGLDDNLIINKTSFTLNAGETKNLDVTFVATNKTGIIVGTINIGGVKILVSLNVRTVLLLFDSNIVVLNEDYKVPQKENLRTKVKLIPMGEKERMDITLNYEIKDYEGKTYLTKSETLLIENEIEFNRNFDTGMLPVGQYIIGLELIYPNGVAPSSAHFEVIDALPVDIFSKIVMFLIILILVVLIMIIIILILRKLNKRKNEQKVV